jgi:hypothetical protein
MSEIIVQYGSLGLNSPKIAAASVIVIERGVRSRTGQTMGNVDEGFCVDITAYGPLVAHHRAIVATERLFTRDKWDPQARNKIGRLGAYCNQSPSAEEVSAAVERVKRCLVDGTPRPRQIRCVAAEVDAGTGYSPAV